MRHPFEFKLRRGFAPALAAIALAAAPAYAAAPSQTFIPAPQPSAVAPVGTAGTAPGDATPPASEQWVDQQTAKIRSDVEARVARGDMTPDEAERLIGWRRWQLEQQAAGQAPAPAILERQKAVATAPRTVVVAPYPAPYYATPYGGYYYGPYGYGPYGPGYLRYAPGIAVCAGGIGHHFAGGVCF